jgi:hypothetical protein
VTEEAEFFCEDVAIVQDNTARLAGWPYAGISKAAHPEGQAAFAQRACVCSLWRINRYYGHTRRRMDYLYDFD